MIVSVTLFVILTYGQTGAFRVNVVWYMVYEKVRMSKIMQEKKQEKNKGKSDAIPRVRGSKKKDAVTVAEKNVVVDGGVCAMSDATRENDCRNGVYVARLKKHYMCEGQKSLMEKFHYTNLMQVPRLVKIVVNAGVKEAIDDSKVINKVADELYLITGQKPVVTRAKKSIAAFKLRAGVALGCKVTLRGDRMYEFLDRLVNIALPRVRDFRGLSATQINGATFNFGLKEQIIFPEIVYDKIDKVRGMNVTIVTTAKTGDEVKALLEVFDVPFCN